MRVAVIGAGAVGLGLTSCLATVERPVCVVARSPSLRATLERQGFRRSGLFGERRVEPGALTLLPDIASLARRPLDFVLVCTKTTANSELTLTLAEWWPKFETRPHFVVCQNGWGGSELLAAGVPNARFYSARVITGFRPDADGKVEITAHAAPIHMGSLFGDEVEPLRELCAAIDAGGIPCEVTAQIAEDLLAKLLYNCLLNPLGALLAVPYGELAAAPHTRAILDAVAHEIFHVLAVAELRTHWPDADRYLDRFYGELLPPTARHESSMLQDVRAGRETEIDALCGAVVAMAARHGVEAPLCEALTALVKGIRRARAAADVQASRPRGPGA